jgi:uncharacterized protein YbjT (DUF2867 family)
MLNQKIIIAGGAGLVGQNLVVRLKARGYQNLVVIDKHRANLATMAALHPEVDAVLADLAQPGDWQEKLQGAGVVVLLQAQIGGNRLNEFQRNNVDATTLLLETIDGPKTPYVVFVSSSVVESVADDFYSSTKRRQEELILASGLDCPILRPTLMYGWFDRKHLGWLSRFMRKTPVFPVPGSGRYMRQPLYVGDRLHRYYPCDQRYDRVSRAYFAHPLLVFL